MQATTENVNSTFFKGLYKEVWRKLINPGLTKAEGEFIFEIAQLAPGSKVLDLMCGYGRHAVELARKGCHVTAIDNLPDYINDIEKEISDEHLHVNALVGDVLQLDAGDVFDAAICMGNSIAFFNESETKQLLQSVSASLKSGGTFIINSWMIAEIAIRHFKQREWMQVDDYKYLLDYTYKFFPSRIESEHTIIRSDGATEVINGVDYIFTLDELNNMMLQANMQIKSLYATPRKKPFALGDATIYIIAEKL